MPVLFILLFSQIAFAATSAENCLRNFPFPLELESGKGEAQVEAVGDSIILTGENGNLIVHRPKGSFTLSSDGVRCNGAAGPDQGLYGYLGKILRKRGQGANAAEKVKLRIAAKECWNLSPNLNDAIASVRETQKMTDLQEKNRFGETTD